MVLIITAVRQTLRQERQRKVKIYVDTDSDAEEWKENSPGHFVLKRQEGGKKSAKE